MCVLFVLIIIVSLSLSLSLSLSPSLSLLFLQAKKLLSKGSRSSIKRKGGGVFGLFRGGGKQKEEQLEGTVHVVYTCTLEV